MLIKVLLSVIVVISSIDAKAVESVIDLSCGNDEDCIQIFDSVTVHSHCLNKECHCFDDRNTTLVCEPLVKNIQNLIGGPCPCPLANSRCNSKNNTCECHDEYVSSDDRRRCIVGAKHDRNALPIECDNNETCLKHDQFSYCDMMVKKCTCYSNYTVADGNRCMAPFVGSIAHCQNDEDCRARQNFTVCLETTKSCACQNGYMFVNDSSSVTQECLPISTYGANCTDSNDCRMASGDAVCNNQICDCHPNSYSHAINGKANEIRCIPKIFSGDKCQMNSDCYEANREQQVMECLSGVCVCLPNYSRTNDSRCDDGADGGGAAVAGGNINLTLFLIVLSNLLLFIFGKN